MVVPKRYPAFGRCIYCGSNGDPNRALGEEHIIPRSLGGTLVPPAASCASCEGLTHPAETHCVQTMVYPLRPALGIRGRKSNRVAQNLPMLGRRPGDRKRMIPYRDHPGVALMFSFLPPGLLVGRAEYPKAPGKLEMIYLKRNTRKLMAVQGGSLVFDKIKVDPFVQMIAKIGHAYAMAHLRDGFRPFLADAARGIGDQVFTFVGNRVEPQPPMPELHQIEAPFLERTPEGHHVWVVRLRLFANVAGTPTFDVVVGEPLG